MIWIISLFICYGLLLYIEHYENNFGQGNIFPEWFCIYCWFDKIYVFLKHK